MAGLAYDKIMKYKLTAVCEGPLHIGSSVGGKEEVLIHPVDGSPFIQASSFAGAFRAYYERIASKEEAELLFGTSRSDKDKEPNSRVKFQDGIFETCTVKMELRPHVSIDRKTGSASSENGSGQKFDMEYVGKGSKFSTEIYLLVNEKESKVDLKSEFEKVLAGLRDGEILFGGKKSSGAGKVCVETLLMKEFDMTSASDRKLWINEESLEDSKYVDYLDELPEVIQGAVAYRITVTGKTEGALQVRAIAMSEFGKGAPDSENIRDAEGNYIIPGSAFRGVIRSQMEKISEYIGDSNKEIIGNSFGTKGKTQKESYAGNLIFSDTVVENKKYKSEKELIRHRIHIDKFSGGVFNGGLFSERNVTGNVTFNIDVLNKNNPDATLGLLILALRDLAIKSVSVGNGYATGKGFINVDNIFIEAGEESTDISFKNPEKNKSNDLINKALKAVKEVPSCQ